MAFFSRLLQFMIHGFKRKSSYSAGAINEKKSLTNPTFTHIWSQFSECADLSHQSFPEIQTDLLYFETLTDKKEMLWDIITPLSTIKLHEMDSLLRQSRYKLETDSKTVVKSILSGSVALFHRGNVYLVSAYGPPSRSVQQSETETVIAGPHDAFTESASTNISLIRRRIKSSHLKVIQMQVGEVTKTDVYVLYIEEIVDMDYVHEAVMRIKGIEIDAIYDGNMLVQYIDDCPNSIFPQFLSTERPDAAASKLSAGRIVIITDNSPAIISAPTSFFEFFSSSDDYYQRWQLGTASRLLRFLAFTITIAFTALYVSVTTYHYEMIPENLLFTLTESRSRVPFPPVIEALLMETMIELLREAGARLPTKIGQTIGIVGGIVIGQAAVQAGLTSNILIIAVASSAIASFVIPSYIMSASIRLIRFGLVLLAGVWGNMGLMMGITVMIVHLTGIKSLGAPYLIPIAPMRVRDWGDTFVRTPLWMQIFRPTISRSSNVVKNKMKK